MDPCLFPSHSWKCPTQASVTNCLELRRISQSGASSPTRLHSLQTPDSGTRSLSRLCPIQWHVTVSMALPHRTCKSPALTAANRNFFKKKICLSLRAWVFSPYVCIYVMRVSGAFEGPSEGIRSPGTGVEIWVTIWVLGPEPGSSARAANALSRRAISPSPSHQFYDTRWMFYSWIFILFRFGFLRHIMALKLWCAWNSLPDSVLQSLGSRMFARQTGA